MVVSIVILALDEVERFGSRLSVVSFVIHGLDQEKLPQRLVRLGSWVG